MSRVVVFFLLTVGLVCSAFAEDATTNCHDPASWADWNARAAQHPEDTALQTLHALWMGLCLKVEQGGLTLEEAITIFERARRTLVKERTEEQRRQPQGLAF